MPERRISTQVLAGMVDITKSKFNYFFAAFRGEDGEEAFLPVPRTAAFYLQRRRRGEETDELRKTEDALEELAEYHAPTVLHLRRVGNLAFAVAQELNLSEAETRDCYIGASLHDLGKLWMPADILDGSRLLTVEEVSFVQIHPERGFKTAYFMGINSRSREIILRHHERINGTGYPHKLTGEVIPLGARITAVADLLDVFTFGRPYLDACGLEGALDVISSKGNRELLDKRVIDAATVVFRQGVKVEGWPMMGSSQAEN